MPGLLLPGHRGFGKKTDLTGHLRLSLDLTSDVNLFTTANYIGEADVPHEVVVEGQEDPDLVLEKSDSFFDLGLGLSYRVPIMSGVYATFSVGVKNLTNAYQDDLDTGPDRDPAYVYGPTLPRTVYAGFEVSF